MRLSMVKNTVKLPLGTGSPNSLTSSCLAALKSFRRYASARSNTAQTSSSLENQPCSTSSSHLASVPHPLRVRTTLSSAATHGTW